jgi:hypothetical protein
MSQVLSIVVPSPWLISPSMTMRASRDTAERLNHGNPHRGIDGRTRMASVANQRTRIVQGSAGR